MNLLGTFSFNLSSACRPAPGGRFVENEELRKGVVVGGGVPFLVCLLMRRRYPGMLRLGCGQLHHPYNINNDANHLISKNSKISIISHESVV